MSAGFRYRRRSLNGRALIAGLALLCALPAGAETSADVRLWLGGGYDSNARRDFVAQNVDNGVVAEPDYVLSALGSAQGALSNEFAQASAGYDAGVRKFLQWASEDVLSQAISLDGAVALGRSLGLGVWGRGKDRRGGDRDYSDLSSRAYLEYAPDARVQLRLEGGAHRFLYWNRFEYSFGASELGVQSRYRFNRRHSVFVLGDASFRKYQGSNQVAPGEPAPEAARQRGDLVLSAGAGYSYRGPFTLSVSYGFTEQDSSSYGESTLRHRLSLTAAVRLPAKLTLLGQVAVQLSRYPDGVYLSSELNLEEDEESHNSASLKLARPLGDKIDLELKYALYQNRLPQNGLGYLRQVGWLGLNWRVW